MTNFVMHVKRILGLGLEIKSILNYLDRHRFSPMCFNIRHILDKFKLIFKFLVDVKRAYFMDSTWSKHIANC